MVFTKYKYEPSLVQWKSIRTSNQKVLGSTPDRSTRISFFPSMPVSLSRMIHHSHKYS